MDYHRTRLSDSRSSSMYSDQSEQKPQYPLGSLAPSGSRPASRTSYTPSYMSIPRKPTPTSFEHNGRANIGAESQTRSTSTASTAVEPSSNGPPSSGPPGVLLVVVASSLHPNLLQHVETLLTRQSFSGIVLAAKQEQEAALKQLKMDTYALIGKLRREMSVETQLRESWSNAEISTLLHLATRNGASLQGVLVCPDYADSSEGLDVFELGEDVLERSWKQSVAFLHATTKAVIPQLLSRATVVLANDAAPNSRFVKTPRGPFFIVASESANSAASQIARAASDVLIRQLQSATNLKGLTVGNAESLLIPDPIVREEAKPVLEPVITNVGYDGHVQDSDFAPGESPTKLWALYNQLDNGF
ncbi:hypothetical protein Slin14017_G104710 [Septoria linicola]|nr:hypothetical protein Slin14017_G104710 [Septoria linicola]